MVQVDTSLTTGLQGLDRALKGLIPGDNVVFQVYDTRHYASFVDAFWKAAILRGKNCIYFRFARHAPLIPEDAPVQVVCVGPEAGFEIFIERIHEAIETHRGDAWYVFDNLSDLAVDWYSDTMLGNFFALTCPYIYDVSGLSFFGLSRNNHSFRATTPILETAQVILDIYSHESQLYVHPRKVQQRHSSTMHMLHVWQDDDFLPVTESVTVAKIMNSSPCLEMESARYRTGVWQRGFLDAELLMAQEQRGENSEKEMEDVYTKLLRMAFSREDRVLTLIRKYLSFQDVLNVGRRIVGSGLIGGKSVGMLLSRAIVTKTNPEWGEQLEPHDSFYIGSDVFYTFLVSNGIWWLRQKQKHTDQFLKNAEIARQRMLMGQFPKYIEEQFQHLLDYYGQSPIIVRSSSLLEDNFGNAFAGKYESVFLPNQGFREQRFRDFLSAVKKIYASSMSEKALRYRESRGLLGHDEQMALLVQRVSGSMHEHLFYPTIAGVGLSYSPYAWSPRIDPKAGMIRLVVGLGTRAVDRSDDDYTRIVPLNAPEIRPESNRDDLRRYAQRKVDVLDLHANQLVSTSLTRVVDHSQDMEWELFADEDRDAQNSQRSRGVDRSAAAPKRVAFEKLFRNTTFIETMRKMLGALAEVYECPVDIEFTANFRSKDEYSINLVQCRPLQVQQHVAAVNIPDEFAEDRLIFRTTRGVIGSSRRTVIDRIIYIVPEIYSQMPLRERYSVARLVGKLMHHESATDRNIALIGPGRWGTTSPALGIPIVFAEIDTASVICELVEMHESLIPDVSLGTHFFNDLVEYEMLYLAFFPDDPGTLVNRSFLCSAENHLAELSSEAERWHTVVRVIDPEQEDSNNLFVVHADAIGQKAICILENSEMTG